VKGGVKSEDFARRVNLENERNTFYFVRDDD
jgi:hypothetical protein